MKQYKEENNEQLSAINADILMSLSYDSFITQRNLSETTGYSLGAVNHSLKQLRSAGYLDENFLLTKKAHELLIANSPRNAIILAAGLGMRMVPINLTTPKALIEVSGEPLIDRLISQLHSVNVRDITVIVGFMKDSFEYLIDDYNVELVYNPLYNIKNNISSLALVADKIGNSYILPCDIWCEDNPFRSHELYSWYMVSDQPDGASFVRVNRKMELVRIQPDSGGNSMIGISYLTKEEGIIVRDRIKRFCLDSTFDGKFWEEALFTENRMIVQSRVVPAGTVIEINTYEQLRDLDSRSKNLTSEVMKNIAEIMDCDLMDVSGIELQKKGMTNRSFSFEIRRGRRSGKYLMRIPGEGTEHLINRLDEAQVYQTIHGLGFCDDPIYIDPIRGWKISKYIEGVRSCDPYDEVDLRACMKKLRTFHNFTKNGKLLTVPNTFDLYERINFYESLWNGAPSIYRDYQQTKDNLNKLLPFIEKYREPFQLTHIDAVPDNFLFDPGADGELSVQLTDWEYAGMQDKHVDLAMFSIYSLYNKQQIDHLLDIYFEEDGGFGKIIRAKIYCYIAVCGLIWSNWCEYKRNLGVEFGEYSLRQYRYAKDYYKYAINLIEEIRKEN